MNHLLPNIYHAVVSSQAWVALCFALLCIYVQLINGWDHEILIYISFFATLFAYNFSHWVLERGASWRLPIMISSGLICLFLAINYLNLSTIFVLFILGMISVLYSWSFNLQSLRHIPQFKMLWIALVWSVTTILPAFTHPNTFEWNLSLLVISIFCFVVAITIPFDIRDMLADDDEMQTLPQLYGVKRSIGLAVFLIFLSALFFLGYFSFIINIAVLSFLISLSVALIFILRSHKTHNKWFTAFWLEGVSALPFIIYLVLK